MTFTNTNSLTARFITVLALISMMMTAFPVAFSVAEAAVSLTTATIDGGSSATVAPGATVTIDVTGDKGNVGGCENNWNITRVTIEGQDPVDSLLGSIMSDGPSVDSVELTAPTTPGDYTVLVELIGGGESFGDTVCDDSQVWDSVELSLSVVIDPSMKIVGLAEEDAEKYLDDTITYTAEIEIDGVPETGDLQCVVFDIYNGDGWQVVDVSENDYSTPDTYYVDSPVYELTDANGFALVESPYDVIAIALDANDLDNLGASSCADIDFNSNSTSFTTDTYHDNVDSDDDVETLLYLVEPKVDTYLIDGHKFNDENGNGIWDEGENGIEGWTINLYDGEELSDSTETDESGYYSFMVPTGSWTVEEQQEGGWTQTAPETGYCLFEFGNQEFVKLFVVLEDDYEDVSDGTCDFGNQQDEETETGPTPGGGNGIRISLTEKEPEGQVLGATTDQCGMYLYDYMREGMDNKVFEVQKLQLFLLSKGYYNVGLSGVFDNATDAAVRDFQAKNSTEILKPWVDLGLMENETPTGYVFKLTRWMINDLVCPSSETYPTLP